jgi:hypothetical protein
MSDPPCEGMRMNRTPRIRRTNRVEARIRRIQDPVLASALRRLHRLVLGDRRLPFPEQLELPLGPSMPGQRPRLAMAGR